MKNTIFLTAALAAVLSSGFSGCASQSRRFLDLVQKSRWEEAVERAKKDPKAAEGLAVAVIEDRAASGHDTANLVTILAGAGREGRAALARLEESRDETVSDLAFVAAHRRSAPSDERVRQLLSHTSSDVRAAAATAWSAQLDPRTAASLLRDIDPRVRRAGVLGLIESDEVDAEQVSSLLTDLLRRDPSAQVRAAAARRGDALGADALSKLLRATEEENLGVRLAALTGLAALKSQDALDILRDAAAAPFDEKTVAAAAELARLGDPLGVQRMNEALEDESRKVRLAAVLRLERAGLANIEEKLRKRLDDEAPDVVILAASMAARRTEDPGDLEKIKNALRKIYENSGAHAQRARDLLATLSDTEALEGVRKVLRAADEDRVITTLHRVRGVEELRGDFLEAISGKSADIRLEAAIAIVSRRRY